MTESGHDRNLADAFDGQAAQFERAPVQSDPAALARLVAFADLPAGALVLDAGCGPGLVAEAFLGAGFRVVGVDLSAEMIARARGRCEAFGERARFAHGSVFDLGDEGPFDAAISRYVIHHVGDPFAFVSRQAGLLRVGGVLVVCDHTTDPDPAHADWHRQLERARDRTHVRNLTPGALVDLLASAGLDQIQQIEEPFTLDFDEWFDRGTPAERKEAVKIRLLTGPPARGFHPTRKIDGGVEIACWQTSTRGVKPAS